MNLSDVGAKFIAKHEIVLNADGSIPAKYLIPYNDPVNFATIAVGHLIARRPVNDADRAQWGRLTQQQALDLFRSDLRRFIDTVASAVKVPLIQNQFDALVSFSFNVGEGAFKGSTLLKKLNAGDYQGAANEFPKWNKAKGKVLKGLTRRRKEERELFLRADSGGTMSTSFPHPANRVELQRGPSSKFGRAEWLHPVFRIRLEALHDEVPFSVTSGGRSTKRQAELYNAWRAGRGNPANRPGTSWHEYDPDSSDPWTLGQAADIEPIRGKTDADLHRASGKYGLHFPIKGEPWHIQPKEAKSSKRTVGQGLGPLPTVEDEEDEEDEDMIKYGLIQPEGGGPTFGVFVLPETVVLGPGTKEEVRLLPGTLAKVGFTNGNVLEALITAGYAKGGTVKFLTTEELDRIPHLGNV